MKKLTTVLMLLCCFVQMIVAQTMSDKQIMDFIMSEQKKGVSETMIASKLIRKGVTLEKIRTIKEGIETDQQNSTNEDDEEELNKVSRLRKTEKETTAKEETTTMEETDIINIFGRNIFNNKLLTFEPAVNIPLPSNYTLGAGDQIIVDIWGASRITIDDYISPDGFLMIDGVGPVFLSGKTLSEAKRYVKSVLSGIYSDSEVNLTVGNMRSVQVQVMGEVVTPGTYTISSLSTAFNALYAAGGINDIGTLRNIKIYRGGKEIATIDVYEYILNGKTDGDVRLQDNDVINVGAYNSLVTVEGKVKRPMIYEMADGETLFDLISYAGGFTGDAYTEKINVTRKSGREYSMHTISKSDAADFKMKDGDAVNVEGMLQRFSNMIEISGAVFYPGKYELGNGISTVRELIEAAGGVIEAAFLDRAVLQHRNFDNTIETEAIDLNGILAGTLPDVRLKNNDLLFVPDDSKMQGELTVNIAGEVNLPGTYQYAENTTIEDLILQAGGLTRAASQMKIDVFRHKFDPQATEYSKSVENFTFSLNDGFEVNGASDFVLEPFDEVFVRRNPTFQPISVAKVTGCVNYEGGYVIPNKNYRLSDLVKSAGGITEFAYIKGASLTRKMTEEERKQREIVMQQNLIQMLEERMSDDENEVNMVVLDSLMHLKLNLSEVYSVAINLADAIENPGSENDVVLRAGDVLNIPEQTSTIKVSGEVNYPVTLTWEKGKNVKYYIKHAGGYSEMARKRGVYMVYMNGDVVKVSKNSKKIVEPGCEIVVPRKSDIRKGLSTAEIATIGSSTASIAAMVVAIINLLK